MKTTICSNCKAENQRDDKKCHNCNEDLKAKTYIIEIIIFIVVFAVSFVLSYFYSE